VTFGEWAADYLTTIVHLRTITRRDYQRILSLHLLPVFAKRPIATIEPIDVRRFMAEKQAAGQAPKSLQKMRLVLRQVLELARASGAIKSNPCDGLRLPRAVQMEPIFLCADEVEVLARATRPPYDLLVRVVAATGLRPSEVCGLRVGRVNLMKRTMEISEALTVVGGRTEVGPTKTYARRSVATLGRPLDPDDYIFTAPRGGPLRRDLLFKRFLRPAIEAANLPPRLRLHDYADSRVMPTFERSSPESLMITAKLSA
jgi:integrase